jgi:hypothetical protein
MRKGRLFSEQAHPYLPQIFKGKWVLDDESMNANFNHKRNI